jgi:hypothetical protein
VPGSSLLPLNHQSGPKEKVLIKQVGNPLGELKEFQIIPGGLQIDPKSVELGLFNKGGQGAHDSPGHHLRREKRRLRPVRENSLENLLDKGVRKREAAVCTDSMSLGELKGNPPFHAFALNKNHFLDQRGCLGFPHHARESVRKELQPITREKLNQHCVRTRFPILPLRYVPNPVNKNPYPEGLPDRGFEKIF